MTSQHTYLITIGEYVDGEIVPRVTIGCDSIYRLPEDLTEWVKEEIDPAAEITIHESEEMQ